MEEEVDEDQPHQNQVGRLDEALIEEKLVLNLVLFCLMVQVLNRVHDLALILVRDLILMLVPALVLVLNLVLVLVLKLTLFLVRVMLPF